MLGFANPPSMYVEGTKIIIEKKKGMLTTIAHIYSHDVGPICSANGKYENCVAPVELSYYLVLKSAFKKKKKKENVLPLNCARTR